MLFELTAPDWHGKHSQWAWNLQTNPLLIDLHLIWPLKPIEGSQRMGEGRSPQRPQAAWSRSEKGRVLIRACLPARGDYSRTMPHFPFQNNRPARLTSVTANVCHCEDDTCTHTYRNNRAEVWGNNSRTRLFFVLCKCVFWVYSPHFILHSLYDTQCLINVLKPWTWKSNTNT